MAIITGLCERFPTAWLRLIRDIGERESNGNHRIADPHSDCGHDGRALLSPLVSVLGYEASTTGPEDASGGKTETAIRQTQSRAAGAGDAIAKGRAVDPPLERAAPQENLITESSRPMPIHRGG